MRPDIKYNYSPLLRTMMQLMLIFTVKFSVAQNTGDKRITLNTTGTIAEILNNLSSNYQIKFSYSSDKIPLKKKIHLNVKDETLQNTLKKIFEGTTIGYKVNGNNVILYPDKNKKVTISGYIKENGSSELLPGVNIYLPGSYSGTSSNNYGFYSITLPSDTQEVIYSYVGYTSVKRKIFLSNDTLMDISLSPSANISEVIITDEKKTNGNINGHYEITPEQINNTPALLGEKDALNSLRTLPGVTKESDLSVGYNIRGGSIGENLIIIDDAPIYNAYHAFGLYSIFNSYALKNVRVIKGGFPARYGGRLSSVIEVSTKEGSKDHFSGDASIGLVTSHLSLEGPILKERTSFFISARRTYFDPVVNSFLDKNNRLRYSFIDLNAKVNHEFNAKNKIYASVYSGQDKFDLGNLTSQDSYEYQSGLLWGNRTATLRFNHLYNSKMFSNTSVIYSNYSFNTFQEDSMLNISFKSGIEDVTIKHDVDYFLPDHHIRAGLISTYHQFNPSSYVESTNNEYINESESFEALESALYIEDEINIGKKLTVTPGVRLSIFTYKTTNYVIPEPRLMASYKLTKNTALNVSYSNMNQFIHLLTNSTIGLPTDMWLPSTDRIKPQKSNQIAIGVLQNIAKKMIFSAEAYYKKSDDILNYKPGISILNMLIPGAGEYSNEAWEDRVISGQGWAYGTEFMLQKNEGKFTFNIAYALSWAQQQFEELNRGEKFWANYDRRHSASTIFSYRLSRSLSISAMWTYASGNPFTLPVSQYIVFGHDPSSGGGGNFHQITEYSEKNSIRMSPYHRMDIACTYENKREKVTHAVEFGAYNIYNRKNPLYYTQSPGQDQAYVLKKVSLFGIVPGLSYSIKF